MFHVPMTSSPRPALPPPPMHSRLLVREAWPRRCRTQGVSLSSPAPAAEGGGLPTIPSVGGEAAGSRRLPRRPAPGRGRDRSYPSARSEAGRWCVVDARDTSGSREVLKRALSPPVQRRRGESVAKRRWWNFRPTPSRLSNMSLAAS